MNGCICLHSRKRTMKKNLTNSDYSNLKSIFANNVELSSAVFSDTANSLLAAICSNIVNYDIDLNLNDKSNSTEEPSLTSIPFLLLKQINIYNAHQEPFKTIIEATSECLFNIKIGIIQEELSIEHVINIRNILLEYNEYFTLPQLRDLVNEVLIYSKARLDN